MTVVINEFEILTEPEPPPAAGMPPPAAPPAPPPTPRDIERALERQRERFQRTRAH